MTVTNVIFKNYDHSDDTVGIGELSESTLHNQLKNLYSDPGDQMEYKLDGYYIDVKKPDYLLEIQTSSFGSIKPKYNKLLKNGHKITMVYPIAESKWLVKIHQNGKIERRKSPYKGKIYDVFRELVSIPKLLTHPHFTLEILMIIEEEYRRNDGKGSWRRQGWSITDHKLNKVLSNYKFTKTKDFISLLPNELPEEFTTGDISVELSIPKWLSQKMVFTLKKIGCITPIGKRGRFVLYTKIA